MTEMASISLIVSAEFNARCNYYSRKDVESDRVDTPS